MSRTSFHVYLYRLLHRYNPFREEVGLRAVGNPGPDSPVVLSGNYAPTVDRLEDALAGIDAWLLVADSAGINVWCAAGVGDFNEHKIVDVVTATGLAGKVRTRRLITPPLAAVGIDRRKLHEQCGFDIAWGPSHLDDLAEFMRSGHTSRRLPAQRLARFPLRDRLEMGVGMVGVFAFSLLLLPLWPRAVLWFYASIAHAVFGTLLLYDQLPARYPANKTVLVGLAQLAGLLVLRPRGSLSLPARIILGGFAHFLIAIDMIGSTPFFKTTILHWLRTGTNDALFQPALNANCTSCGACAEVCPKGIFEPGPGGKMAVHLERDCCECMACAKQCPSGAIDNAGSGWKDDIRSLGSRFPATTTKPPARNVSPEEPG